MKRLPIPAALLRGAACLAALAFALPAAVFAADHSDHNGWTAVNGRGEYKTNRVFLSEDVTVVGAFQLSSPETTFCLGGHTLTLMDGRADAIGKDMQVDRSLVVVDCGENGKIIGSGAEISVGSQGNLTLQGGRIDSDITVHNKLTVDSGSTVNGTITVKSGASATIGKGTAKNIHVKDGGAADVYGTVNGTITVDEGGTLNIHDGAEVSGGVETSGTCNMSGGTVTKKGITVNGGACTIDGGTVTTHGITVNGGACTITDSTIKNVFYYSGVYVDGGTCTIDGTTEITENNAQSNAFDSTGNGGGVYVAGGSCIIQGSAKITKNNAQASSRGDGGFGGGVYVAGGTCTIKDDVQITGNAANANVARGGNGGGVYVAAGGECIVNGVNAMVSNNHADGAGGGVYVEEGGSFTFLSHATNNTAGGNGGGIYLAGSAVGDSARYNMDGAVISENNALNGGGIYAGKNVVINMRSGRIGSNTAIGDGGGVYLSSGAELYTYAQIKDNVAGGNGGGIRATDGCIIYLNKDESFRSAVFGNKAGNSKNGMYVDGSGWYIEVNGTYIYDDLYLYGREDQRGKVNIETKGIDECIISGVIQAYYVDVIMKGGTVSSNSVNLINTKWENAGGYCNISTFTTDGKQNVTLYGGYFDSTTSLDEESQRYISVNPGYKMIAVDENTVGTEFDENFPYGVYPQENEKVTVKVNENITYDGLPVEPGTDFTLEPAGTTLLKAFYKAQGASDDAFQEGLPTNAGIYTIKAECLNASGKWYAETTFTLTISKADPTYTTPSGLTGLHGHALSEVTLPDGWTWKDDTATMTDADEQQFAAKFTPTDTDNYNIVDVPLTVTVAHDWGDWKSNGDNTHTGACKYTGCTATEKENCSGGTAGYFKKAVCAHCGGEYGDFARDITPPTGTISIQTNKWSELLKSITFDLFFKETQTVTITAEDDSYQAEGYTPDKAAVVEWALYRGENPPTSVQALEDAGLTFTAYTAPFSIEPDDKLVVYAKITDHANNITYISSDGLVLDGTVPAVTGVENGGVYYVTRQVTVADENLNSVTLNGAAVTLNGTTTLITLEGNRDETYVITAADKAGNVTTVTVTMKPIAALEEAVKDRTADNIAFEDEAALNAALAAAKGVDLTWATQAEQEELAALITRLEGLATVLAEAKAVDQAVAALPEAVEPDDAEAETDILAAKAQFDALTEHQRQLIPEAAKKLEKLLADLKNYRLVEGDGSDWRKGDQRDMTFTANGPLSKLTAVLVDGQTVDPANYTAVSGSTILTLKRAWLETLAVGDHTLTVQYPDGAATGSFEILEARAWTPGPTATPTPAPAASVPATGEDGPLMWVGLLAFSAVALAAVWGVGKRGGKK